MTGPGYDLLVVLHALSAVLGFGAVGVTGTYATRARSVREPRKEPRLRRYFHPSTNWAERSLLLTPVLGAVALWTGDRSAVSQAWPWIGLGCWVLAAAIATAWCWPAERRIQTWLADSGDPDESASGELAQFQDACRALQWGASAMSVCFLAAVVVMIGQPR
ncbi:MAG: DUF2269 family protein [Acidimicrobiales bacterium]|jgi:hypothetical protein